MISGVKKIPMLKYPKLTSASNVSDANVNRSANVHNGSFVSVRNISLGYTFKDQVVYRNIASVA
jgi:hypothetical protein